MEKRINIIPIICDILEQGNYENEYDIRILSEIHKIENKPTKFYIALLICTNIQEEIKVQLLLRNLETGLSLDIGVISINIEHILNEKEKEKSFINVRHFIDIETTFPESGKYILDTFLLENEERIDFYKEESEEKIPISSVDFIVK